MPAAKKPHGGKADAISRSWLLLAVRVANSHLRRPCVRLSFPAAAVSECRDQVPEHVRERREAVHEQHGGSNHRILAFVYCARLHKDDFPNVAI